MHHAGQLIRQWRESRQPPLSAQEFGAVHGAPEPWPSRTVYGWEAKGKIPRPPVQKRLAQMGICQPADWLEPPIPLSETPPMTTTLLGDAHPFYAMHSHGYVRVATSTPQVRTADIAFNCAAIVAEARRAHAAHVDLLVYPELCLSSYMLDDLVMQSAFLARVEAAVAEVVAASRDLSPIMLIGAPLLHQGQLYNCALVIAAGQLLGVVPKSFLPNYREFYEKRWYAHGRNVRGATIQIGDLAAPFGTDLVFASTKTRDFVLHVEICEDMWSPAPPSINGALAGATICTNLSASNIVIGKSDERHLLARSHSSRASCAYVYSASGHGESTTDHAWDGEGFIYELGELLVQSERFSLDPELAIADVDCQKIMGDRIRHKTFDDAIDDAGRPSDGFRRVAMPHNPHGGDVGLQRPLARFPFVPDREHKLDEDCYEAFNIQVDGLMRRIEATRAKSLVIGISGGLDSTHALIVAAKCCDRLGLPRETIRAFTMPGFGTTDHTKGNAWKLMQAFGVTAGEIDIRPAANTMLKDIGHAFADGHPVYDVTFENVQAGLRTDYLFRLASQHGGFVIGTGDLSELALGWCTYGVGDHMSHYGVNSGVPKTLIQHLIRWAIRSEQFTHDTDDVLQAILDTEISPELVPVGAEGQVQSTEGAVGPYELNDFFLHQIMRWGMPPSKVAFMAWHTWRDLAAGEWPPFFPEASRNQYDLATIARWLEHFLRRFFQTSQYKRSALPNGPKVSSGGALSPRGDWRAPSDAVADVWLEELRLGLPQD